MKIKVLGCYGGELPGCNVTGFLLDGNTLIDAGTVASKLTIQEQRKIKTVFLSHAHLDHVAALPLYGVNIVSSEGDSVTVASAGVTIKALQNHLMNWVIWPDFSKIKNFGGKPVFEYQELKPNRWQTVGGYQVKIVPVNHSIPTHGIFFGKADRYALYTGDTKQTEAIWAEARKLGSKLKSVIIEAAFPNELLGLAENSAHLVPQTVELELHKLGKLKPKIFIDHMKPEYITQIKKEIKKIKGFNITVMEEGKTYNL